MLLNQTSAFNLCCFVKGQLLMVDMLRCWTDGLSGLSGDGADVWLWFGDCFSLVQHWGYNSEMFWKKEGKFGVFFFHEFLPNFLSDIRMCTTSEIMEREPALNPEELSVQWRCDGSHSWRPTHCQRVSPKVTLQRERNKSLVRLNRFIWTLWSEPIRLVISHMNLTCNCIHPVDSWELLI